MAPALTASRAAPSYTLASGSQQAAESRRQSFAGRALVVGELAIALVFLTGAGLVAKTFWRVTRVDPGFRAEHVLLANIKLGDWYTDATADAFWDALMARVRREPGVRSAAFVQGAPMTRSGIGFSGEFRPRVGKLRRGYQPAVVDPEYFETIGAQLVAGRFLAPENRKGAPRVAVVSEGYAARNLDGAPALGSTVESQECPANRVHRSRVGTLIAVNPLAARDPVQRPLGAEPNPTRFGRRIRYSGDR